MIDLENISLHKLNVVIKRKKHEDIKIGNLYAVLPKIINEDVEKKISRKIINSLDDVVFNCWRYLGNYTSDIIDEKRLISGLKEKLFSKEDIKLGEIYSEFLNINKTKDKKNYRNYSSFLEFYLHGKDIIPDTMKKIYLEKVDKKILNYDDLEKIIRDTFSGNIYKSHEKEINDNNDKIKNADIDLLAIEKDLSLIEQFIRSLNLILKLEKVSESKAKNLKNLVDKENKMPKFLFINKINITKKILEVTNDYKKLLETKNECYESLKNDISIAFPKLKLKELNNYDLMEKLNDLDRNTYLNKGKILNTKESIIEKNETLRKDELDLEYFFDRINSQKDNILSFFMLIYFW